MFDRAFKFFIIVILIGYLIILSSFQGKSFASSEPFINQGGTEGQGDIHDTQVEQILSEGTILINQRKQLAEEIRKNDLWEKQLKKEDTDIKSQWIHEEKNVELFKNFNENVNKETREYNNYCKGKYPGNEYERRRVWCSANEKRIQDDQKKRNQIGTAITQRLTELENRKKKLYEDTPTQFDRKKALNNQWEDWNARQESWMSRYRQLMMTPVMKDMERRAKISIGCANMTTLEDAHQCLQSIWDHARQKNKVKQ